MSFLGKIGSAVASIGGAAAGAYLGGSKGALVGLGAGNAASSMFSDSGLSARKQFEMNANLQREFAQNSIQWKVQDAIKAGIHPLAALGASGYSASPVQIDNSSYAAASQNRNDAVRGAQSAIENAIMNKRMAQQARLEYQKFMTDKANVEADIRNKDAQTFSSWAQAQEALSRTRLMEQSGTYPGMPVSSADMSLGWGLFHYGSSEYPRVRGRISGGPNAGMYDPAYRIGRK